MRVADKMAYDQVNAAVAKNRGEMGSLQNQAATQKRVTKPSDDPVAASRVLATRVEQRGNEQFIKNLNYAKGFLDFTEQSLNELTEVLVRAKELAISQANDASANQQSRKIVAAEVAQIHDQAVQIANRKLGERFIFGGFKTTAPPFDHNGTYHGDTGEMKIHVDKESFLSMNIPGSQVFEGRGMSRDGITYKSLEQARTVEQFQEQKEIAGSKAFVEEEDKWEELRPGVRNSEQPLRGPASVRPGLTDIAGTQAKTMSTVEGTELTEGEKGAATKQLAQEGENVFHALKKLQIALTTNDKAGVQESMDRIDSAMQQVVMARTSLGSRVMAIDNTLNSLHTIGVDNKGAISQLEDADAFEVISDINKTEGALQATLQTSGKLIQKSLMDFIS